MLANAYCALVTKSAPCARQYHLCLIAFLDCPSFLTVMTSIPIDLPLNFHPAAVRASANVTPFGAVSVPA